MRSGNSEHRLKRIPAVCGVMLCIFLSACGGKKTEEAGGDAGTGKASETAEETKSSSGMHYPGTEAAEEAAAGESPYYGIMHATVLDINGKINESDTVYSFTDKSDPENSWSVTGLEIGDIETELSTGTEVVILFNGDIINDSENVDFLAVLPEGDYEIRKLEGEAVSNTMSSFTVKTPAGMEVQFLKDNCRIDSGALNGGNAGSVTVYYADGGENGRYPLRVFKSE